MQVIKSFVWREIPGTRNQVHVQLHGTLFRVFGTGDDREVYEPSKSPGGKKVTSKARARGIILIAQRAEKMGVVGAWVDMP
jgi:hypothetical protein